MKRSSLAESLARVARKKIAIPEQRRHQDSRSRLSHAAERDSDRARADSIKQVKERAAIACSQVFDQQGAFDDSRRVEAAMFKHLVEIGRAGVSVTAAVAQTAEDAHSGTVI